MHSGKLDMLTNRINQNLTVARDRIHLHFLGMLNELAYHNRVLLGHIRSQFEETFQFLMVGTYVHCSTAEHIRRAHQHRKTDFLYKCTDILHGRQRPPLRLVNPYPVQHSRKLVPVLGIVDALCTCTENVHILRIEAHREVVRDLSSSRNDDTMRSLFLYDIHDPLKRQLVKIQAVANVIVRRNRLRIVIYHY